MEDVSGRRLDWFWREWFLEGVTFDQAIDTVFMAHHGRDSILVIGVGNYARGVLPIRLRLTFTDGMTQDYVFPAEVWSANERRWVHGFVLGWKGVRRVELDPEHRLIDVNRDNNSWSQPGATTP